MVNLVEQVEVIFRIRQSHMHYWLVLVSLNEVFMAGLGSNSSYNSQTSYPAAVSPYQPSSSNSHWFVDSSTTNHITTSLNNLSMLSPYHWFVVILVMMKPLLQLVTVFISHNYGGM